MEYMRKFMDIVYVYVCNDFDVGNYVKKKKKLR